MQIYRMMIAPMSQILTYNKTVKSLLQAILPNLSRIASLIEEKKKQSDNHTSLTSEEKEVERDSFNLELDDDPFDFWNTIKDYPIIAPVACEI